MVTKDKKEYLRNRFANLPEEKKEEHRMRRLADIGPNFFTKL